MAGWAANKTKLNSRALSENDMVMGPFLSQKSSGIDLMQNCDLPPPMKVFSWPDNTVISSMNKMMGQEDDHYEFNAYRGDGDNEKLELFKALRLSQTRAREAERKATSLAKERDCISNALLEDSMRLFAYQQWEKLLDIQVSMLRSQWQREERHSCCRCHNSEGREGNAGDEGGISWFVALALCLGIAGVGFAFGCRYLF